MVPSYQAGDCLGTALARWTQAKAIPQSPYNAPTMTRLDAFLFPPPAAYPINQTRPPRRETARAFYAAQKTPAHSAARAQTNSLHFCFEIFPADAPKGNRP